MSFMLDASAVLAVLLDEPGGDYVFDQISESQISTVNLSEVYATLFGGRDDR
jgi:PIN domain nuclease of toxin-antitoxin system